MKTKTTQISEKTGRSREEMTSVGVVINQFGQSSIWLESGLWIDGVPYDKGTKELGALDQTRDRIMAIIEAAPEDEREKITEPGGITYRRTEILK